LFASRFFRRLFLPYLLLICASTASVGAFAAVRLRSAYLDRTRESLAGEARLASAQLESMFASGQVEVEPLSASVSRLASGLGCRVTVIDESGKVLADSDADAPLMDNHQSRPEIVAAAANGEGSIVRPSHTMGIDMLFLARETHVGDKKFFVRLAVPLSTLSHELQLLSFTLVVVTLTAMGLAAVICFYFASRHTAPVRELAGFAEALARGEMGRRLMPGGAGEIGAITSSLNIMADSLSGLVQQLAKERGELLAIVASMNEGVIATDIRQRIVLVNDKAAELLDFSGGESAHGKPLWELVHNEPILRAAGEVLADGERKVFQISPSVGRYLEIAVCTYPSAGKSEGLVLVAHDTSKSVRYQELRKEFVANVSHELRTPLTVIRGFTETLRDGALNDPVAAPKFLATINKHVDQLQNLVGDLLELSKLESSPELPRRVSVDMGAVTRRVADLLLPASQKKNQSLTLEIPSHIPRILGSADYLERAVSNLIDNAIKYTPEHGAVHVTIGYNHEFVTLEVQDNGIGIPPADLDRIFERFYRVDRSRSREMGGTGLGLSIVKHVAQVHGGSVEVTSAPGAGSKFRLKIPLPKEE